MPKQSKKLTGWTLFEEVFPKSYNLYMYLTCGLQLNWDVTRALTHGWISKSYLMDKLTRELRQRCCGLVSHYGTTKMLAMGKKGLVSIQEAAMTDTIII